MVARVTQEDSGTAFTGAWATKPVSIVVHKIQFKSSSHGERGYVGLKDSAQG